MSPDRSGWDRLLSLLERLQPGDTIRISDVVSETGLEPSTCSMVLDALTRVDLFTPQGDGTHLRRRLLDYVEPQPDGPEAGSTIVDGIKRAPEPSGDVRIRITDLPADRNELEGFDLRGLENNHVYDVSTRLAELLIVMSYAAPEMRRSAGDTADDRSPRRRRSDHRSSRQPRHD